jgi:site-specific recombinase XerD
MTKIRLSYVQPVFDPDTSRTYYYYRRRGYPRVMLPGSPGSPEFMTAYQAAGSGNAVEQPGKYIAGSIRDLVAGYYRSVRFKNVRAAKSKRNYRLVLDRFIETDGHRMAADMPARIAHKIIEEIGATKRAMANLTRSVLHELFEYAIDLELRSDNPFGRIKYYKTGKRHTWTDQELDAYRKHWPLGTRQRLAFVVLLYTDQRISDAVKLKRSELFAFSQQKTGTEMKMPVHPAIVKAAKAMPQTTATGLYLITDERTGRPVNADTLGRIIREAVREAGMPWRCTAHGLRKANQRILAERGATVKQMQGMSGHKTLRESERYSEAANRAVMASQAIALLPDVE